MQIVVRSHRCNKDVAQTSIRPSQQRSITPIKSNPTQSSHNNTLEKLLITCKNTYRVKQNAKRESIKVKKNTYRGRRKSSSSL